MGAKITNLVSKQFSTNNSVKTFENTLERTNSAVTLCIETLDSLNERYAQESTK